MLVAPLPMDRVASEYYLWSPEGKPVSVHLSLEVVRALQPLLQINTGSRPLEHGGLLSGRVRHVNDSYIVCVEAMEPVDCGHARGASWTLTASEKHGLERKIRRQVGSSMIVGWFRTHTRPGLYLDQHDFSLFNDYFPHPASVALVIRPEDREAAFFFWEDGDIHRASPYQTFPFVPQALGTRPEFLPSGGMDVELVAVPAARVRTPAGASWRRRALYAAPIAAGLLAGFLWQPDIERRRARESDHSSGLAQPERAVFPPPEMVDVAALSPPAAEKAPSVAESPAPAAPPGRPRRSEEDRSLIPLPAPTTRGG